jgi:hypothetical protein
VVKGIEGQGQLGQATESKRIGPPGPRGKGKKRKDGCAGWGFGPKA